MPPPESVDATTPNAADIRSAGPRQEPELAVAEAVVRRTWLEISESQPVDDDPTWHNARRRKS